MTERGHRIDVVASTLHRRRHLAMVLLLATMTIAIVMVIPEASGEDPTYLSILTP
jgi:hypothetical protein